MSTNIKSCEKCVKYTDLKWVSCPKCGNALISREDLELAILSDAMKMLKFEDVNRKNTIRDGWDVGSARKGNTTDLTTVMEEPIWRLILEKVEKEHGVKPNYISMVDGLAIMNGHTIETVEKLARTLNSVTSKVIAVMILCDNEDDTQVYYTLLFTEKEFEDAFEVLRGKNWLFDGLLFNKQKGAGISDIRFGNWYKFNRFYRVYRDMIKKAYLKKIISSGKSC
jgi:RNA polymerase subunit RPABC4/transcription elongation factor Spt4